MVILNDVGPEDFLTCHAYISLGAEVLTLELEYPIRKQVVVEKYRNMLASHPNIKIAIVGRS